MMESEVRDEVCDFDNLYRAMQHCKNNVMWKDSVAGCVKNGLVIGVVGSVIASLFGGWDAALVTLVIFMAIDYVTGLLVAGVFHNSGKTENGALESRAGWKGLCRKCITLLMVLVATRLDLVTGTNFIRDAVVIAFIANETISIVENAGLMGINIPPAITSAIEVLKKKSDSVDNTDQ